MERHFIDISEDKETCGGDLRLKVHLDPVKNYVQERSVKFPWIYRIRSAVLYLEELEPEQRIQNAYLKSERASKGTFQFRPYKKPYTSCIQRKFTLEDPSDPKRAILKYCRETPMRFVIFSKPGLNVDSLAIEVSKYWGAVHVNPQIAFNAEQPIDIAEKTEESLRNGGAVGIIDILIHVKEKLGSAESKKHGYVLTGLPMRHHMDSDFHILEQMEMIFETENRPDIIIYVTSPSPDIRNLNEKGFICNLKTGFHFNKCFLEDAVALQAKDGLELEDLEQSPEHDYKYFLLKELNDYNATFMDGIPVDIGKLPSYSENLVDDYVRKILPIIDSYVLEYDMQCVVKLDGRIPVANMFEIVKSKLSTLPYIPTCKAKPIFDELIEMAADAGPWDDRSEDSIKEFRPEPELEEEDDEEETELGEEEEYDEEIQQEEEEVQDEAADEDGERPAKKVNKELQHINNMVPREALKRLKDYNKVDVNFKWSESDHGAYCPVQFERGDMCLGAPKYTCTYLGNLYMMSTLEAMNEFISDPNRYAVPPKPFPTFKIFVTGPPLSGKSSVIRAVSEFFDLRVIHMKKLMQEVNEQKFFDLEIRELLRKQKKRGKVQDMEDTIFNSYEKRRCTDILNWIREQLPYIYHRIKFTSLIQISSDTESVTEIEPPAPKELDEDEESQEEEETLEFILPMQEGFLETVNRLTKPDLKTIIALKKYTVDLPVKSGYEKIYENIGTDQHSMLMHAPSYEDANVSMNKLQEEFKERGLDFDLNIEDYIGIFLNPARLLTYLPNQYRQPYYDKSTVQYDDPRVRDPHTEKIGIRTAYGFVSAKTEQLVDKFENAILDIEAENNLRQKGGDLEIGGWIVDDVPLDKTFWNLLVERYLLPDDIIVRTLPTKSHETVVENFCAVDAHVSNEDGQKTEQQAVNLAGDDSDESLKDVETDRFLVVRNSFLKVNKNYETELEDSDGEGQSVSKTCATEKENKIITQEVLDQLPKPKEVKYEKVKYKFSTNKTAGLNTTQIQPETFEDPFNLNKLSMKPFHLHFWTDDKFLVNVYQDITEHKLYTKPASVAIQTIYVAEKLDKSDTIALSTTDIKHVTTPESTKDSSSRSSCSSKDLDSSTSKQSISSSEASIGMLLPSVTLDKKSYLADKARMSLLRKQKMKRPVISVYDAIRSTRRDAVPPETLFELHGKIILDVPKTKSTAYDLFQIFYREINSHMSTDPKTFELKYLTEIKTMLEEGADLVEVANAMMKYLRKVKKTVESQDNVLLKRPSVDIEIDKNKVRATSGAIDVLSQTDTRGKLRRTGSRIQFDRSASHASMDKQVQKGSSISRMSELPLIDESLGRYIKEEDDQLGSNILCYKDSHEDMYKSSSILLNVELVPSERSVNKIPEKNDGWTIRLPKIDGSGANVDRHSCYCLNPQKKTDICECSSSSNSEIEAGRKKKRLCIYDDSSLTIFPWIPVVEQIRNLLPEETVEPLRRHRPRSVLRTIETIDKEKDRDKESTEFSEDMREEFDEYEGEGEEEEEEEEGEDVQMVLEEQTGNPESSRAQHVAEHSQGDKKRFNRRHVHTKTRKRRTNDEGDRAPVLEYAGSTTVILPEVSRSSALSVLYKTSTEEVRPESISSHEYKVVKDRKKIEGDSEDTSSAFESELRFRSKDTLAMTLINIEGYGSDMLLPGFEGNEWETFIAFINSLYLSVSSYKSLGIGTDTDENFYLECCPSTSETSLKDYQEQPSVIVKKLRRRWSRYMKAEGILPQSHEGQTVTEGLDEDDICLLEVALPMAEAQFNTALTTTLKCLTLGKTISELFSANKHDRAGGQRLTTSALNIMYKDDTIKELKTASESFYLDRHSDVMQIDDVASNDAIFNSRGQLVQDNRFVELYDGQLMRYKSMDQRFTPSLDMLSYTESDNDQANETDACPEFFLSTVPRAILYVPYVVPRFRPITTDKRVTPEHLRRYYSLQSMCRLVCVDSDQSSNRAGDQEEQRGEEEALKFRYILKPRYKKTFKSIYIHRPHQSLGNEEEEEEEEEEDEEEGRGGGEEEEQDGLKHIQDIIEPLIDVFREEIIKAEMSQRTSKLTYQGEGSRAAEKYDTKPIWSQAYNDYEAEILGFTDDDWNLLNPSDAETHENYSESDEIEGEIDKHLTFSYPYDIIRLMFQKFDFITIQIPEDDMDETLATELSNIKTPKRFQCFLDAFEHNVKLWLNEWDAFKHDVLSDVHCNVIELDFVPFTRFKTNLSNSIAKLLRDYGPQAECVDINKEKLIKTINLETADLDMDEIENLTDAEATDVTEIKEKDIGDVEIRELLPNEYSDFHPYCPVLYKRTNELVPVNNTFNAEYREKYFNFSTEDDMNEFIKWPEHYSVVKDYDYETTPIRICVVAPRDFDETFHIGRSLADCMALPFKTLTAEIKRIRGGTLNLPVGVFDEDQTNIKMFGLDETNEDPRHNILENTEWDHIRNYFNLKAPLTDNELEALIEPMWKAKYGHVFHAFPHAFEDFEYMVRNKMVPDAVVFIDVEEQRVSRRNEIEDRIKARRLLNFGARLKRLLTADHLRYKVWKEAYPKLFNIVLRKFLRERRAERNFRERLNLVLPTLMPSEESLEESEEMEDFEDVRAWDVEWLLYQVEGRESKSIGAGVPSFLEVKKVKKYFNVLDDPNLSLEDKKRFLEQLQKQKVATEIHQSVSPQDLPIEEEDFDGGSVDGSSMQRELVNLSDTDFPDVRSIFESNPTDISEEEGNKEERLSKFKTIRRSKDKVKENLLTESEEQMNAGIKIMNRRQVAVTDMFDPPFQKKYLPKFRQVVYKSHRPFDEEDYRKNVTDASSTSFLGHDETDSIESRELTSSLSLLDVESRNKQLRLMQLVFGNKTALKDHFMNIVNQFKELHPTPLSTVRKLKTVESGSKRPTKQLKEYYKVEKEHMKRMKDLCETNNIPYVVHKSKSHVKYLAQNVKNVIRKPHALERVYIVNYKTAYKLLENGFYFLSRFGHWCPVQLYDHKNPFQEHYSDAAKEHIIIPIIHKRYIYFLNGRNSAIKFAQSPLTYIKQQDLLTFFPVKAAVVGLHKSNKTVLAKNLAKQKGLQYISVDQTIRYVLENLHWSDLAKNILVELRKGDVVSHAHTIKCIEAFINGSSKSLKQGWVLDGFPNTVDDLLLMRENDIVPNVIFGLEPAEMHVKEIFSKLNEERTTVLNDLYDGNEFFDLEGDEDEDDYIESAHAIEAAASGQAETVHSEGDEIYEKQLNEFYYNEDVEEEEEEHNEQPVVHEEPPESFYVKRIKELLNAKHSVPIEPIRIQDFDRKPIDFELDNLPPPAQMIETRMLRWLKGVKTYDRMMDTALAWWGNSYKLEWTKQTAKLQERIHEILTTFVWAQQDYNLSISKGLPAGLYLTGITEEEYRLHKSPFNECCPGCWYYYRIYFRCPTCLFKDMKPGMIQYENYFYWVCIQHYDMFLSNPVKFLTSYEAAYGRNYPEKTVIGESFLQNNLDVQYDGLCITCYYNHLPDLKHVKGYGKHSVIISKTNIYLFCSDKCVCEMLMRPSRYLNLEIEYVDQATLPSLRNIQNNTIIYKKFFEQLVTDAIYDSIRKFLYLRPKLFKLSHKTSACTYLALHLKLKAKNITQCERVYYKGLLKYMEKHCQEVETVCRNIDQIFAFYGPLAIIEQTKAKCLPPEVQHVLLKNLLPSHRQKKTKRVIKKSSSNLIKKSSSNLIKKSSSNLIKKSSSNLL